MTTLKQAGKFKKRYFTGRQENLVREIINGGLKKYKSKVALVEAAGYSHKSALKNAQALIDKPNVQRELKKLGFDIESAKKVVIDILQSKSSTDTNKLKAVEEIFKVQGAYAPEKKLNLNVSIVNNPKAKEISDRYEKELRENLLKDNLKNNELDNNSGNSDSILDNRSDNSVSNN